MFGFADNNSAIFRKIANTDKDIPTKDMFNFSMFLLLMEGQREEGREGGREGGREEERKGGRERRRKGEGEEGREGERKGGRERRRGGGRR